MFFLHQTALTIISDDLYGEYILWLWAAEIQKRVTSEDHRWLAQPSCVLSDDANLALCICGSTSINVYSCVHFNSNIELCTAWNDAQTFNINILG